MRLFGMLGLVLAVLATGFKWIEGRLNTVMVMVKREGISSDATQLLGTAMHDLYLGTIIVSVIAAAIILMSANDRRNSSLIRIIAILISMATVGATLLVYY